MPVKQASRHELIRLLHRTEGRLRIIIDQLPPHSKYIRLRLGQLATQIAHVLAREIPNTAGDD